VIKCGKFYFQKVNLKALWPIRGAEREFRNYFLWNFTLATLSSMSVSHVSTCLSVFQPSFHAASSSMSSVRCISNVTFSFYFLRSTLRLFDVTDFIFEIRLWRILWYRFCGLYIISILWKNGTGLDIRKRERIYIFYKLLFCSKFWLLDWHFLKIFLCIFSN
jgi:hypothetical protein